MSNNNDFFGYTSAIPRPPDAPEDPNRQALSRLAAARDAAKTEEWRVKHAAWLAEQAARAQAVRDAATAAHIERFKVEQRESFARVGLSNADFVREWPAILRSHQLAEAERDPLADEKARLLASGDYGL